MQTPPSNQFLQEISELECGYGNAVFSYHARKAGEKLLLLHGRLALRAWENYLPEKLVRFTDQEIGRFQFSKLGMNVREFVEKIRNGDWIESPNGPMRLFNPTSQPVQERFEDLHQAGLEKGHRFSLLGLQGGMFDRPRLSPQVDWELKAGDVPYDGMWELLTEFHLAGYLGDFAAIEIMAFQVAEIDLASTVDGELACPAILLSKGLDISKCKIGYRVQSQGRVETRGTIHSEGMQWTEFEHQALGSCFRGVASINIPIAAGVHCYAVYSGRTQHEYWIGDRTCFPNWRRVTYEEFDPDCKELLELLFSEKRHKQEGGRILERGVAWLLWLLGFSVIRLDSKKTENGPDLLAVTPGGRMVIIECTTDFIDSEKLGKLVARKQSIASKLVSSSASHVELLPILVTPLRRSALIGLEKAYEQGVAIIAREELETALNRALVFQDADDLFQQIALSIRTSTG